MIEGQWTRITCRRREALINQLGRGHNGFSAASGICVLSSLTDLDGRFGRARVVTEWGYRETGVPVLRDERFPGSGDPCEHHEWIPTGVADECGSQSHLAGVDTLGAS